VPALFWSSSYVASHCSTVAPQSDGNKKLKFVALFSSQLQIQHLRLREIYIKSVEDELVVKITSFNFLPFMEKLKSLN
jgi:hypothetical protein